MPSSPIKTDRDAATTALPDHSSPNEDFPRPLRSRSVILPLVVALVAIALIPFSRYIDVPMGLFLKDLPIKWIVEPFRFFVSPVVIFLIVATIWLLDPRRRATIAVILVAISLSQVINQTTKYVSGRTRPRQALATDNHQIHPIISYLKEQPENLTDPEAEGAQPKKSLLDSLFEYPYTSFPSGHANAAFALAGYLSVLYPQGRLVWYLSALGCGTERIEGHHHYFTDVLFGAATGWLIAQIVFSWAWPVRLGKRLFTRNPRAGNEI